LPGGAEGRVSLTRKFIKIILIPTSAQHDVTRHGAPADPFITEFAYADQSADGDSASSLFPSGDLHTRGVALPIGDYSSNVTATGRNKKKKKELNTMA